MNVGPMYDPSDFEPHLAAGAPLASTSGGPKPSAAAKPSGDFPPAHIELIENGCAWLRHCRDDAGTLPEPEWYGMLSIVGRCENGEQLAHEWSRPYPQYTPEETQRKLTQALRNAGPRTCEYI